MLSMPLMPLPVADDVVSESSVGSPAGEPVCMLQIYNKLTIFYRQGNNSIKITLYYLYTCDRIDPEVIGRAISICKYD